jgi:hypothetical protein
MTQKHTPCTDFHWIGETLMAKEFGEVVEICTVDWHGLDEYEAEHKRFIAAAPCMLKALEALMDLNDNGGPFGGEIYQDRVDRAWDNARAAIAEATGEAQ